MSRRAVDEHNLHAENQELRLRLAEAEETLRAIRNGDVDAVVVKGRDGEQLYSLHDPENIYRRLVEAMQQPTLAVAPDGAILYFNDWVQEFLKSDGGKLTGNNILDLIHKSDQARFRALLKTAKATGQAQQRTRLQTRSGRTVVINWRANLLKHAEGPIICLAGTDLTQLEEFGESIDQLEEQQRELKRVQAELEVSRDHYAVQYNFAPVGFVTLNPVGLILDINTTGAQLLGRRQGLLIRYPFGTVIHPADHRRFLNHLRLASLADGPLLTPLRLRTDEGRQPTWIELISVAAPTAEKWPVLKCAFTDITARKQAEDSLKESEGRFRTLASHAPVGIFMSKANGDAIYVNDQWCQLAGLTPEQSLGKGWLKAVHPDDRERIAAGWKTAVGKHDSSDAEFRFLHPDGTITWIEGHATRLPAANGEVVGYIGTVTDVTQRRQAEEALRQAHDLLEERVRARTKQLSRANAVLKKEIAARKKSDQALHESEQRLRLMVESTHDCAILMLDPRGGVMTWNASAEKVTGYRASEILGRPSSCFYPRRDIREGKPQALLKMARITGHAEEEGWRVRKDGSRFWASTVLTALYDEAGKLRGFSKVTRDITERRKAQEESRLSEKNLADFFDQSPLGLLWVGPTGDVRRVNRAALELFGCALEDCLGRPVQDFHAEPELAEDFIKRLAGRDAVQNHRARLRGRNGNLVHALIDANGLWERGRLVHSRWFLRDITRRVELEREILNVVEEERLRMGQDLHDDLCQQLTGIEFLSQTLAGQLTERSPSDSTRAREIARMVRQAMTHTRELARGLSPAELEVGGLTGALQALADRTRRVFRINCQFKCRVAGLKRDPTLDIQLYRIAQEAVANAIKHGRARRVEIGLAHNHERLVLAVKDNGLGIRLAPRKQKGMGLRLMKYRAGVISGSLLVQRNQNRGTTIVCSVGNAFVNDQSKNADENK